LIYDPCEWEIEEEEAIARMITDELDRLVLEDQGNRSGARQVDCAPYCSPS
jgi:hypothetical protein